MTITRDPIQTSDRRGTTRAREVRVGWLVVFAGFATLYALTASRGIQWQDAGVHIVRIMRGELVNSLGLALSHPLHYWLGRGALWFGFAEPAFAITLVSALVGAVAVANVYGCVVALTGRAGAGAVAACSLGFANTFWQMATLAECNTLTAALLSAEVWAMVAYLRGGRRTALYLAFLFNGLGVANHMQAALTTPLLLFVLVHGLVRNRLRFGTARVALGGWIVGSLPYTGLVVATMVRSQDAIGTISSALFGNAYADAVLNVTPSSRQVVIVLGFILLNFPNLTLPLFLQGSLWRRRGAHPVSPYRFLFVALAIHALFALRYNVVDQHTFFLPTYVLLSIVAGAGFIRVMGAPPARRRMVALATIVLLAMTPFVYVLVPGFAHRAGALDHIAHEKPYRNDYVYLFVPWTVAERSAERVGREAIELAGDDGLVLIEDPMARPPVEYERLRNGKTDIEIMLRSSRGAIDSDRVERALVDKRTVVLVPLDRDRPAILPSTGVWRRVGDLYVLDRE